VIDPLDASRESLRILLEDDGHRVLVARLASEGMDILDRTPVDLIVVDMLLRDGSGTDFCRRLRASHRTELIPVLMLCRAATVEHEVAGIGSGADGFLSWPFHPEVLRARVNSKLLRKSESGQAGGIGDDPAGIGPDSGATR